MTDLREEKIEDEYKTIPLKARIIIRLVIALLRILHPILRDQKMAAYFSIESYADLLEDNLEEAEATQLQ
jgi:hypothetical protein